MKLRLTVQPKFCGPASIGTVSLIRFVRERCELELHEAKAYIDRAVFEGEEVDIPLPAETDGQSLVAEIGALESPAQISVRLIG